MNSPANCLGKRLFDLALAMLLLLPSILLCLVLLPIIIADHKTTPIFVQTRVGQFGTKFSIFKLRTMNKSTKSIASHLASSDSVTNLGRILRHLKIDELPQLVNVLFGQMSFIGPRPCLESQIELIALRSALGVSVLKPGITGFSQIAGLDMSDPESLAKCDSTYLMPWSLKTDLLILLKTIAGSGQGDAILP